LTRDWFNCYLARPSRFTAARPPYHRKQAKAICWFKDTAHEHIAHAWSFAVILENHDVPVRLLKTKRVGYVVYEDLYQIVAEAFSDSYRR